ncbi:MAG: hypothetical protein H7Z40_21070 [Phycisphaerae bacterium]|nr:hypothetical protein [Gemmatimonadaceae bacterium]
MSFLTDWRLARERRRRAAVYLSAITQHVAPADIAWLASLTPDRNERLATRELEFARRAIGLIVAERDALDDRTASDVAHQLATVISSESRRDSVAGRVWSERWRAYTGALAARGSTESPAARLARVMLAGAGVAAPSHEQLVGGTQYILAVRSAANDALRTAYGSASLPEDVRPSAVRTVAR